MKLKPLIACVACFALGSTVAVTQEFSNKLQPADGSNLNAPSGFENQGVGGALLGDAVLFAIVNSDGAISGGKGERSVTRIALGTYEVVFWRNVSACAFLPTISSNEFGISSGIVSAVRRSSKNAGVFVETKSVDGDAADRDFTFLVIC
ncbi:MAG: hypothetical protein AAFR39_13210 [Pseudomonadota bacterium]